MVAVNPAQAVSTTLPTGADPFETLRAQITGAVIEPGAESYDPARTVLNFRESGRRPKLIVQAADENDVAAAVTFVRENGLRLAVRSGGHALAAGAEIDGAVLIDLAHMAHVSVDPIEGIARIQPGATSNVVAAAAHEHGLALSTGDTGSVGMGGLGTGGGIGFMVRAHGLTIDNVLSARVVTADGRIRVASAIENPDLFWAIRGGGSNFGVVTEFTVRLAPVDQIYGGLLVLPATREVLDAYLHHGVDAPEELTTIGNVMICPPMPFIAPEHVGKRVLAIFVCWSGAPEDAEAALAPLRALGEPIADLVNVMPYPAIFQFTDMQSAPHGDYIRSMFACDLGVKALDKIISAVDDAPAPMSIVQIRPLGGAMSRVDQFATAFPHRDSRVMVAIIGLWMDPADDGELHRSWVMQTWAALRGEGRGVYVNFLEDEGADRLLDAYGKTTYDRLAQIKRVYDPQNLFRHNQNIAPAN